MIEPLKYGYHEHVGTGTAYTVPAGRFAVVRIVQANAFSPQNGNMTIGGADFPAFSLAITQNEFSLFSRKSGLRMDEGDSIVINPRTNGISLIKFYYEEYKKP